LTCRGGARIARARKPPESGSRPQPLIDPTGIHSPVVEDVVELLLHALQLRLEARLLRRRRRRRLVAHPLPLRLPHAVRLREKRNKTHWRSVRLH
jgi:hypothetical protein